MDRRPHLLPRVRPLFATLLVVALALSVAACGDDDEPAATGDAGSGTTASTEGSDGGDPYDYESTTGGESGGDAAKGTIVAEDFSLTDVTVAPGDPIKLKNEGGAPHTATADEGEFDLGQVAAGETSDPGTAPDEPGDYAFHCEIHPNMTATLTVEG
jgi:plastocyanin